MSKRYLLGAFSVLAVWSCSHTPIHVSRHLTIGSAANADEVRWTPDPKRGRASNTLSGGRRGAVSATCAQGDHSLRPAVTLLVPEEAIALTTKAQPTLVWYVEGNQAAEMEFVLLHPEHADPIYTKKIQSAIGLVEVTLPESAALEVGVPYRWTVSVTCDHDNFSVHTRSLVERVEMPNAAPNTSVMSSFEQASFYASQGIWYDALNLLIDAYRQDAQIAVLQEFRSLLRQINTDMSIEPSLAGKS